MAMYICGVCDRFIDDDYNPGTDINGELCCEDCIVDCEICGKPQRDVCEKPDRRGQGCAS